jgi:hypothetical protein
MIKKIVLTIAVAAFAVSAPTASFAKKMHHHASKCTPGQMMSGKPNAMGWAPVMACGADGKMYQTIMMCMMASSLCPPSM